MGAILTYFNGQSGDPNVVTGMTPRQLSLVKSSWADMKKDMIGNGLVVFMEFFARYPEYKPLFSFKDISNEDLKTDRKFKAHIMAVMYSFSSLFDNVDDNVMLVHLLQKNGVSHIHRDLPPKAYYDLIETMMVVLQKGLGAQFTEELRDAWTKMLKFCFDIIIEFSREMPEEKYLQRTREILVEV